MSSGFVPVVLSPPITVPSVKFVVVSVRSVRIERFVSRPKSKPAASDSAAGRLVTPPLALVATAE
jgi:hypothetical protein